MIIAEPVLRKSPEKKPQPPKISIEEFLEKYRDGGPGVKYEYNKGVIETTEAMKFNERYIIVNLRKAFSKLPITERGDSLECETEVWTSEDQWRKPDLSFSTIEQTRLAMDGFQPIPAFLIEVISPNDKADEIDDKVIEYFEAGVNMLWLIFPRQQTVKVYRSPDDIQVCRGSKICSAEPIVEGFKIKAEDIFRRP